MIDADTFKVTTLVPDLRGSLSISADASSLLITNGEETKVDLNSLKVVAELPIPESNSPYPGGRQ